LLEATKVKCLRGFIKSLELVQKTSKRGGKGHCYTEIQEPVRWSSYIWTIEKEKALDD